MASATGPRIEDVDEHTYVDFCGDYTAGILGHTPAAVAAAVSRVLVRGWAYGACPEDEVAAADLLCRRFPSIEAVRFVNSGTEANLLAISTAKLVKGKPEIVVFRNGFHGSLVAFNDARGSSPLNVPHQFAIAEFNDIESVIRRLATGQVAAVIIEPMQGAGGCIPAAKDFLKNLRKQCSKFDALLIFDEVMTSRLDFGGLQSVVGVSPDITTLGKYIAGGLSFGAMGGDRDVLEALNQSASNAILHSGTFNNNAFSMAATRAVLEAGLTVETISTLNAQGEALRRLLATTLADTQLPLDVSGYGSMMSLRALDQRLVEWCFHYLLDHAIYIGPTGMVALSTEITPAMVNQMHSTFTDWCNQASALLYGHSGCTSQRRNTGLAAEDASSAP